MMSFAITIGWLMINSSLIKSVVGEREKSLKNQMIVSGIKLPAYWLGHYVKDIFLQCIPSMFVLILINAYDMDLPQVWVLIIINIFANPPFLYALSFAFAKADAASTAVGFLLFLVGFLGPIALFILLIIDSTRDYAVALKYPLSLIPLFSVSSGIITISMRFFIALLTAPEG